MPHGDLGHFEIPADDIQRAKRFYEGVFGWQFSSADSMPDYEMFTSPSGKVQSGGAIGKRGDTAGEVARQYVTVDSVDAALTKTQELGGSIVVPKDEVPGMGLWAAIKDTEGNEIGIWEDLPGDSSGGGAGQG